MDLLEYTSRLPMSEFSGYHRERKRKGKDYLRCTQPTFLLIIISRMVGCVHHNMFTYPTLTLVYRVIVFLGGGKM